MSEGQEPKLPAGRIASALASAGTPGTAGTRLWDFVSRLATLTKEQERHSRQLEQLTEQLFAIAKDVQRMAGRAESMRADASRILEPLEQVATDLDTRSSFVTEIIGHPQTWQLRQGD